MTLDFLQFPRIREAWDYRSDPDSARVLATIFWRALLVVAAIALIATLWFGFLELGAAAQAENFAATSSPPPPPFNPAQLQATLAALSARQSEYQSLASSSPPAVADPSK